MALDELKAALPDYAKDLKLNLGSVIGNSDLPPQQLWGTVLACAIASLSEQVLAELARDGHSDTPTDAFAIERFDDEPVSPSTTVSTDSTASTASTVSPT